MMSVSQLRRLLNDHAGRRAVCEYSADEPGIAIYEPDGSYVDFIPCGPDEPEVEPEPEPELDGERERRARDWIAEHAGDLYKRPKGRVIYQAVALQEPDPDISPQEREKRISVVRVRRSSDGQEALMWISELQKMTPVWVIDLSADQCRNLGIPVR